MLLAAKEDLAHGEWAKMCKKLPFSENSAFRLMSVAQHHGLSNPAHVQDLPPSWGTLYELTKLDESQFTEALDAGLIHPEMQRKDVTKLRDELSRQDASDGVIVGPRDTCGVTDLQTLIGKWTQIKMSTFHHPRGATPLHAEPPSSSVTILPSMPAW